MKFMKLDTDRNPVACRRVPRLGNSVPHPVQGRSGDRPHRRVRQRKDDHVDARQASRRPPDPRRDRGLRFARGSRGAPAAGRAELRRLSALLGAETVKSTVSGVLREARARSQEGAVLPAFDALVAEIRVRLSRAEAKGLVEVLNGTGILLHTNLGRAPLARAGARGGRAHRQAGTRTSSTIWKAARAARATSASGRCCTRRRAPKTAWSSITAPRRSCWSLDTFARGREVVVARNQLVEIGGGFRLPDVLARSGARLVEVGTTNKVYLRDYERRARPAKPRCSCARTLRTSRCKASSPTSSRASWRPSRGAAAFRSSKIWAAARCST